MNLVLGCHSMRELSGSPLYNYELARALKKLGHTVTVASDWNPPIGQGGLLRENLEKEGISCKAWYEPVPCDALIVSQGGEKLLNHYDVPAINVSHSELPFEEPVKHKNIVTYVGIRDSIKNKWQKKYPGNWKVIGNPIDVERFNPKRRIPKSGSFYLTLIPCTIDTLREPFLKQMISRATEYNRLIICGFNRGVTLPESEWVAELPDTFYVDELMARVDRVAGIRLGRVNLEAAAMGIESLIVDDETLKEEKFHPSPERIHKEYGSENVAKKLIQELNGKR